ncbi:MAG: hydrogenase 3 maturation endopeptidase HyCI [Candidatus Bathyarchaeota archaeon]|nr:MAG: hydrogenase 3 maturation endopeptidase HyCI [Candidatus Bathyarchaeota archaeon]
MKNQWKADNNRIEGTLKNWLTCARKVVVVGIGNPLRKDDYIGGSVVEDLRGRVSQRVYLIECETVPESFIGSITKFKPTHVLLIDAGFLNRNPGSLELVDVLGMADQTAISTHALPLQIFCEYLKKTTGAKITLLVIQPKDTSFGEGLTTELKETEGYLANLLSKSLP